MKLRQEEETAEFRPQHLQETCLMPTIQLTFWNKNLGTKESIDKNSSYLPVLYGFYFIDWQELILYHHDIYC